MNPANAITTKSGYISLRDLPQPAERSAPRLNTLAPSQPLDPVRVSPLNSGHKIVTILTMIGVTVALGVLVSSNPVLLGIVVGALLLAFLIATLVYLKQNNFSNKALKNAAARSLCVLFAPLILLATLITKGQISFLDWTQSSKRSKLIIEMQEPEEGPQEETHGEEDDNDCDCCRISDFIQAN